MSEAQKGLEDSIRSMFRVEIALRKAAEDEAKKRRAENAALSERLREAEGVIDLLNRKLWSAEGVIRYYESNSDGNPAECPATIYLSKTPKNGG